MQYTILVSRFGGVNYKMEPKALGPTRAQSLNQVDLSTGILRNQYADELYTTESSCFSKYDYNGTIISDSDVRRVYVEYGGRLIRGWFAPLTGVVAPQYSTDASTWHILGIKGPAAACSAAAGAAGTPSGTYTYYVTFYNAFGDESAPSAAATVTLASQRASLTSIPIGYGTGDITNGQPTIANVTNVSYFRVGMRIQSPTAGIPAGAYVTDITGTTITMSANATATAAGITLQDTQVTGRKVYRSGGSVASVLLVTTLSDITTTSYTDNAADTALGAAITTSGFDVLPAIGGIAMAPNGVLGGIKKGSTAGRGSEFHFSEVGLPGLYKSTNVIRLTDEGVSAFYGLDRFVIFTVGVLHYITGSDASTFELQKVSAPAPVKANGTFTGWAAPVLMDGAIWFTCLLGVVAFDGTTLTLVSDASFTPKQNEYLHLYCTAATRYGKKYLLLSQHEPSLISALYENFTVYGFDPDIEGNWYTYNTAPNYVVSDVWRGALFYSKTLNRVLFYQNGNTYILADGYASAPVLASNVAYRTGDWTGRAELALKKFRRVSVVYVGGLGVTVYVDGVSAGTFNLGDRTTLGRANIWLPSGTRGRTVSLNLNLSTVVDYAGFTEVHEAGVWVGEEREVSP